MNGEPITLAVAAFKGGAGKTTVATNLAGALASPRRRVLLVDTDPQGGASAALGADPSKPTLYEALHGQAPAVDAIRPTKVDGLDVLVSDLDLAGADVELPTMPGWQQALRRVLDQTEGYDVVVIDTGPGLGAVPFASLSAADGVVVTVRPSYLDLRSLHLAMETVERTGRPVLGIVLNGVGRRTLHQEDVVAAVVEEAGRQLLTSIPQRVALADCALAGEPVGSYYPTSDAAEAFAALAKEVMRRAQASRRRQAH